MQLNNTDSMKAFAGVGALSALISGGAQFMGGQQQRGAYGYNAAITRQNAAEKAEVSSDKYTALIGKERSLYAKAGVDGVFTQRQCQEITDPPFRAGHGIRDDRSADRRSGFG